MTVTLASWLHNLSPFLVQFSGNFGLRWYGLAYATGFVLGWWWLRWMSKRGMTPLSVPQISDAMLLLVLGVVVGGRLGYVVFYQPHLLIEFSSAPPWWGVFQLNNGGMSSHGGMIGVVIATWFIARSSGRLPAPKPGDTPAGEAPMAAVGARAPWMHVLDLMALTCTVGLMLGRVANFINGELLGKVVAMPGQPAPWWAVKFPQEVFDHPVKLNGEQSQKLMALIDQFRVGNEPDHAAYGRGLRVLQGGGAKAAEVARTLEPLISSRYPSQLMQAATDGLVLGLVLWLIWWKPRKPGVIGAWFMIVYGVLRISTEFVRLPDKQLEDLKNSSGLSMGQWLSVLLVVMGVVGLVIMSRRDVPKMGGWGKPAGAKPAAEAV